jgi:hypothetical protein
MTCLAAAASGATLTDYKQRLANAREEITAVLVDADAPVDTTAISSITALVPATEKIETSNGTVDTQNAWLAFELDLLRAETDQRKRQEIALGIDERFAAIIDAIETLERSTAADRTKDEDKQKLAEILRREEYQRAPPAEESLFQKWWREFTEWLSKQMPRPDISPDTAAGIGSLKVVLQVLVLAAVIGLIGFLIYRFVPAIRGRLSRKDKEKRGARVILGEQIEAHESARDLLAEAERLAREGDLRGAIRKAYVAVLCDLSDRRVIALARHKTNRDYLRDVRRNERLFVKLRGLTGAFESSWYGLRPARTEEWESFRDGCRDAVGEAGR